MNIIDKMNEIKNKIESLYQAEFSTKVEKPRIFRISMPRLINPFLTKGDLDAVYLGDGIVSIPSVKQELELMDDIDKVALINGDELTFWCGANYYNVSKKSESKAYIDATKKINDIKLKNRSLQEELASLEHKQEVENFWKQYDIPFEFQVDIKTVLSGLSANSWGDGSKSNTKYHVVLKEDATVGRTVRSRGEFLCTQPKGRTYFDFNKKNDVMDNIITCPDCLKKLEKFKVAMQDEEVSKQKGVLIV